MSEVSSRYSVEHDHADDALLAPKKRHSRSAIVAVMIAIIAVTSGVVYAGSLAVDAWNRSGATSTSNNSSLYSTAFAVPDPIWADVIAAPMPPPLRIYGDAKVQMQIVPIGGRTASKPFPGVCTIAKGGVLRLYGNKPDNGTNYTAIEYLGRSLSAPAVSGECAAGTLFPWNESMTDSFS